MTKKKVGQIAASAIYQHDDPEIFMEAGSWTIHYNQFKAGEVEKMTGLSVDMQRVWRRRGSIAARPGVYHSKFSTRDVARIALMRRMSMLNTPLDEAKIAAERYEILLCSHILFTTAEPFSRAQAPRLFPHLYQNMKDDFAAESEGDGSIIARTEFEAWDAVTLDEIGSEYFECATMISLTRLAENIRLGCERPLFTVTDPHDAIDRMPPAAMGQWKITVPRTDRLAKRKASEPLQ